MSAVARSPTGDPMDAVLARLDGVRQSAQDRWMARCPGPLHRRGDKARSLSLGRADNGGVLIHCFAGCATADVLAAIGLEMSDLFPPRDPAVHGAKPKVPPVPWRDIMEAMHRDLLVASIAFKELAEGKQFTEAEAKLIAWSADDLAYQLRRARP